MPKGSSPSARVFYPRWTRETLIRYLVERLPVLAKELPLERVVLFGSYATARFTVASDIDLLVVYGGPPRPDAYVVARTALAVPRLEPHLYTVEEFEAAASTVRRMTRDGIVLWEREA